MHIVSKELEEKKFYVYMYTSPSGKHYVGRTYRTKEKRAGARGTGYRGCTAFWNAIQKYGWENFKYEVLETHISINDIDEREKYWIEYYHSSTNENGYNLVIPNKNNSFKTFTDEMRKRMSESCKGRTPWNKGKTNVYTQEQLNKMSESGKGKHSGINNPNYLKPMSDEVKKKISDKKKDYYYGEKSTNKFAVKQYDLNGNYIKTFKTKTEAAKSVGCGENVICACCNGQQKSAKGFQWCNIGDEDKIGKYNSNLETVGAIAQIKDGKILNIYKNAKIASRELNYNNSNLYRCLRKITKTAYGFQWMRLDEIDPLIVNDYYSTLDGEVDNYAS